MTRDRTGWRGPQSEVSEEEPPSMAAGKLAGGWNPSLGHSRRRSLRSHVTGRAIVLGGHFLSPDNLHCLITTDKNHQGRPPWACPSASGPRAQGPQPGPTCARSSTSSCSSTRRAGPQCPQQTCCSLWGDGGQFSACTRQTGHPVPRLPVTSAYSLCKYSRNMVGGRKGKARVLSIM